MRVDIHRDIYSYAPRPPVPLSGVPSFSVTLLPCYGEDRGNEYKEILEKLQETIENFQQVKISHTFVTFGACQQQCYNSIYYRPKNGRRLMAVNRNRTDRWKTDVAQSVDMYNQWFMSFAPETYRQTRLLTTEQVKKALSLTNNLTDIRPMTLYQYPDILPVLRMSTMPPIARDRLIGLANISKNLVNSMEQEGKTPKKMAPGQLEYELKMIGSIIEKLADEDICIWLKEKREPTEKEVYRASTIIADRLCGAASDPIIRNAQEKRQLRVLEEWLSQKRYTLIENGSGLKFNNMKPGTFSFRLNVPVTQESKEKKINMPIDAVIMPKTSEIGKFPLLIEAKSAGDFTNTNKRRKEEATKFRQLCNEYGEVTFVLLLCGYFDPGYLGYEASEGIDWIWEHRLDDLLEFGV
ncbi:MAG TPA: XamI family restriction endonuclease [Ktedonobacteraceae bacterium]